MSIAQRVTRIEPNGPKNAGLAEWPAMNPDDLASGAPVPRGHTYGEEAATGYSVGVWDCTAFDDKPGPYPVDEFMLLLEGSVDMLMPDGTLVSVNAGEAFIIPKGLDCQWKMPVTVRKIYMILDGATPDTADNLSLRRVTALPLGAPDSAPLGALRQRTTHFLNHDTRMRVHTDIYPDRLRGLAPAEGRHIFHVVSGEVAFADDPAALFAQGESFYLSPGAPVTWTIAKGTQLLVSTCNLPD